jgi:NADPH-dependent 2,4-dienoyl-CoA reductase/sulfur reductase-like enzyme
MTDPQAVVDTDVLVVGAGPAGLAAATETAAAGLDVTVVDENPRSGGQIWRQRFPGAPASADPKVRLPAVRHLAGTVCVGFRGPREALVSGPGPAHTVRARAVVLATGAYERVYPVPGWTLPGVLTAGAAQALVKGSATMPYRRVVVAGTGPLLLAVAHDLLAAGVEVAAIVEAVRPGARHWRALGALRGAGPVLAEGARYAAAIARARVPLRTGWGVRTVTGTDRVTGVELARLAPDWSFLGGARRTVECDAVLFSHGFASSVDLPAQLGVRIVRDELRQGWRPARTPHFRTSVPSVYAVGDCAGVGGSLVASAEGRLAGMDLVARFTGTAPVVGERRALARRLRRLAAFRDGMDAVYRVGPGVAGWPAPQTVVCRCQETTAAEVRDAVAAGAATPHGVKLCTRAGMGPCQGRTCLPAVEALRSAASRHGPQWTDPDDVPRARFPVRPITAAALARYAPATVETTNQEG